MKDTDHRQNARVLLSRDAADPATVHALLAIEARLGEIVEQQKLANVIAAFGAGIDQEGHHLEMGAVDLDEAITHVHRGISRITRPSANDTDSGDQ